MDHNSESLRKHAHSNIEKNSPPKTEILGKKTLFFIFLLKTEIVDTL